MDVTICVSSWGVGVLCQAWWQASAARRGSWLSCMMFCRRRSAASRLRAAHLLRHACSFPAAQMCP